MGKGVQPLLDAVVDYLPSPVEVEAIKGIDLDTEEDTIRESSDAEPFSALAFKVATDPFVGTLTFTRIYSGSMEGDLRVQLRQGEERADRAHAGDARQRPHGDQVRRDRGHRGP